MEITHAVVLGASMAGLLAAWVLPDFWANEQLIRVTGLIDPPTRLFTQDHVPRSSGATASLSLAGYPDPPDHIEKRMCARVGDLAGVDGRVQDALPAHLQRERQPAVHGDPDVAFHLRVQIAANVALIRAMIRLT